MAVLGIDIGGSSTKLAWVENGQAIWTAQTVRYARPSEKELIAALKGVLSQYSVPAMPVGLCVPGLYDLETQTIRYSANLPDLAGIPLRDMLSGAWGDGVGRVIVVNDAYAAAVDISASLNLSGRVLVLAIGTGVGCGLIEEGNPILVDADSPGHVGQMDVSLEAHPPIGPDGGAGSLEAYVGAPALSRSYGSLEQFLGTAGPADPPLRALARAIRICHAIYRPHHVVLAGGVGIRLKHLIDDLKGLIDDNLTGVARAGWTLRSAEHDFHAAIGAARIAQST